VLFGLAPAMHASSPHLSETLNDGGRTSGESAAGSGARIRNMLVITEVALSMSCSPAPAC